MINQWDERYSSEQYIYGKEPNVFLKEEILKLKPGKILFPGEGEGRNAVFAAKMGWKVTAFDSSFVAQQKAQALANENNVDINYLNIDFSEMDFELNSFDCIALSFVHTANRQKDHRRLLEFLKFGGIILIEAFSKNQINFNSGGPKKVELLFSEQELREDFYSLNKIEIESLEPKLDEGNYHSGKASVIRLIGIK